MPSWEVTKGILWAAGIIVVLCYAWKGVNGPGSSGFVGTTFSTNGGPAGPSGQQWTFRGKPPGSARHPLCEGHRPGEQFQLPNGQMGMCD
ncbi:hypothetical protein FJY94_02445 [Candidatus Kaiserbacteria bacterium]|nr:hypothetical protein [Candidatus Kaiserbacteria bacterium]